ncbi:MAG: hypothetical protein AB1351_13265 [Thermoproteota archaeon]
METTVTASNRRINGFVRKHLGALMQDLGISEIDVQVFFYLFDNRVYGPAPAHSSHDTYKALHANQVANGIGGVTSKGSARRISEKNIDKSIRNLIAMGLVKVVHEKSKKRGRHAKELFELRSIHEIMQIVQSKIDERKKSLMIVFTDLADIEEARALGKEDKG